MQARYVLVGCIGIPPAMREHVFKVYDCSGPEHDVCVGYMTPDEAIARFGLDELYMTMSHGCCPDCEARYDEWDMTAPPSDPDDPDAPARLAIVGDCRRPRTVAAMQMRLPGFAPAVPNDVRILVRAGYLEARGAREPRRYVATPRGFEACRASREKLISPARLAFRGKQDPDWYRLLRRRGR